jgi:hypothetical protein
MPSRIAGEGPEVSGGIELPAFFQKCIKEFHSKSKIPIFEILKFF